MATRKDGQPIIRKRTASAKQQYLTIPQVSETTGWPERTVYALIAKRRLPFVRFPGERRIWIARAEIARCVEAWTERPSEERACV